MGVFTTSTNVKFNLGTLAPDVVITSPATGTITGSSNVTVSGQIVGNVSEDGFEKIMQAVTLEVSLPALTTGTFLLQLTVEALPH